MVRLSKKKKKTVSCDDCQTFISIPDFVVTNTRYIFVGFESIVCFYFFIFNNIYRVYHRGCRIVAVII